nr:unnamed protein product [Spirometra erinaceieuropaei]
MFRRLKFLTTESDTTVSSSAQFLEKLKGDLAIEAIELLLQSKYDETENRLGPAQVLQLLSSVSGHEDIQEGQLIVFLLLLLLPSSSSPSSSSSIVN